MNLETSITYSFTQLTNNFRYYFDLKMTEINLYGGQVFILIALWKEDHQSQIDLALNLNLSAPTINKMVKSLIERDFVVSEKCKTDGRIMRVHLTPKGIEHEKQVEEKFAEFEKEFFSSLTDTEKLILTQIFGNLRDNIFKTRQSKIADQI